MRWVVVLASLLASCAEARAQEPAPTFRARLDLGHPWRPPFGLDRVSRPVRVAVEAEGIRPGSSYKLKAMRDGKEVGARPVAFPDKPPFSASASFDAAFDEVVVLDANPPGAERARQKLRPPTFEADAVATPDSVVNPVDLGTILVPNGWLVLGPGRTATVEVAAVSRIGDRPDARVRVSLSTSPTNVVERPMPLAEGVARRQRLAVPKPRGGDDRDTLRVVIDDGRGTVLWQKRIPVMLVAEPPRWPRFGATAAKLRYDPPISVRDPKTGAYSTLSYDAGWDATLQDVIVSFPNGARFVFWRGSSYIPFWAGARNTGACYEWAEILSQPAGAVDCVEPLMDKELRYSRVRIVESTPARVVVRWTYQSVDLLYKVWGDEAAEDYVFYPDGFGTRVVRLKSDPRNEYELSEFILITPQDAYPFATLPGNLVDALFLDGRKYEYTFPYTAGTVNDPGTSPAIYRLRLGNGEPRSAIYFSPNGFQLPGTIFAPFSDKGEVVTPTYWGSHWPLSRGNATGSVIDDRIHLSPTHNSVMSWAKLKPTPLRTSELVTVDTLGRSKLMVERTWAWLIGMSDEPDDRLRARAKSYATPPSIEARGARLDFEAYVPERRAMRLIVEAKEIAMKIRPEPVCVNPVFELIDAPPGKVVVTIGGKPLDPDKFAWDGRTLWLDATLAAPIDLTVRFVAP